MKDTRQAILDKALQLFNKSGVEYAGMRELAAVLDIRVGNVTYYFPTKDHLVNELAVQYSAANSEFFEMPESFSLYDFLERRKAIFENQGRYKFLHLSFVHLMDKNPLMKENYKKIRRKRLDSLEADIGLLAKTGYLVPEKEKLETLVALAALTGRLWLTEASIAYGYSEIEHKTNHYLALFANLFLPYTTPKGLKEIKQFTKSLR